MDDIPEVESCKHCKKNVLKSGAKAHIAQCLRVKREKAQRKKEAREARERAREAAREEEARKADEEGGKDNDSDDEDGDKAGKGNKTSKEGGKGKKRKADGEAEKGLLKKKKKEDGKPKTAKPKGESPPAAAATCTPAAANIMTGPVDVERQCGVTLPNGMPCARSLTCKSHSMGAKRAVAGRSLPYDMLLAAYQKKNQAKQQSKFLFLTLALFCAHPS